MERRRSRHELHDSPRHRLRRIAERIPATQIVFFAEIFWRRGKRGYPPPSDGSLSPGLPLFFAPPSQQESRRALVQNFESADRNRAGRRQNFDFGRPRRSFYWYAVIDLRG